MIRPVLVFALAFSAAAASQEKKKPDPQKITTLSPLGLLPGDSTKVVLRGNKLDGVTTVECEPPAATIRITDKPKKITNQPGGDSELAVEIFVPKEFGEEAVELRLVAGDVKTTVSIAVDDREAITREKEPNDGFANAQRIAKPTTILGTIEKPMDVDVFAVELKAGQELRLAVEAASRGSALDGILSLYDSKQRLLLSVDDVKGSRDPSLRYTAKESGVHYFSLIDAHDQGGPPWGYRLKVELGK